MIGIQQLVFHVPQLIGEVHMHGVGVDQTLGLVPQGVQFFFAISLDVHDLGGAVYAFPFQENRNHQFPQSVGPGGQFCFLPGLDGVEQE